MGFYAKCDGCERTAPAHHGAKYWLLPDEWFVTVPLRQNEIDGFQEHHACSGGCCAVIDQRLLPKATYWKQVIRKPDLVGADRCRWCANLKRPCPAHRKALKTYRCACTFEMQFAQPPVACPGCGGKLLKEVINV